ncbi:10915_t:CDS:1, partial [Scutellospora calospora]
NASAVSSTNSTSIDSTNSVSNDFTNSICIDSTNSASVDSTNFVSIDFTNFTSIDSISIDLLFIDFTSVSIYNSVDNPKVEVEVEAMLEDIKAED